MGYVHNTDIKQFIPPAAIGKTQGTWTATNATEVISQVRTAHADPFELHIPLSLPISANRKGSMVTSIDVWYSIGTAEATGFAGVELVRTSLPAHNVAPAGTLPARALDGDHDTETKRRAISANGHKMTVSFTTPVFLNPGFAYYLVLKINPAATTVFTLFGAQANITLRL